MKRTRSPSPSGPSFNNQKQNKITENENEESSVLVKKKTIKSLAGVEIHPLLSGSGGLTLPPSNGEVSIIENPFLAHLKKTEKPRRVPHVDKNLVIEPTKRRSRPLKFNAPGKFIAKAEAERSAAQIRQLEREIAETTEDLGLSEGIDVDVSMIQDILRNEIDEVKFEWWDVPFLKFENENCDFSLAHELIGNLIQRPNLRMTPKVFTKAKEGLKIYLTPDERKKLRRQRRLEAQKELQEKISLGLLPPPAAKVKLSSLPRMLAQPGNLLGDESVQDPTRIAAQIREQSDARQELHQQSNAQRKLTDEERAIKKFRKFAELDAEEVQLAVFKLNDRLEEPSRRFKILINAQQNHLHGRSITTRNFTLIIVEGGPKGIKRYTRLLLERIEPTDPHWSQLLWTGTQAAKTAEALKTEGKAFQMKVFYRDFEAVEFLEKCGYSRFWSLAKAAE